MEPPRQPLGGHVYPPTSLQLSSVACQWLKHVGLSYSVYKNDDCNFNARRVLTCERDVKNQRNADWKFTEDRAYANEIRRGTWNESQNLLFFWPNMRPRFVGQKTTVRHEKGQTVSSTCLTLFETHILFFLASSL